MVEYELYQPTESLSFILTEDETLVKTNLQTFLIQYDHRNYSKQLRTLREMIRQGNIKRMDELINFCDYKPSESQLKIMTGLELVSTKLERHIND